MSTHLPIDFASSHKLRKLRRPRASLTPTAGTRADQTLFSEVTAIATRRIRLLLWLAIAGSVLGSCGRLARLTGDGPSRADWLGFAAMLGVCALSSSALLVLRRADGSARRTSWVAWSFEVMLGYILGAAGVLEQTLRHGHVPFLTWAAPLVVLCALLIPAPPRRTLVVALATSSSVLAGVFLAARFVALREVGRAYLDVALNQLLAVIVAYVCSGFLNRLLSDYADAVRVGAYRLQRRLSAGGMGEIWLAEHQLLARPAAVKLMNGAPQEGAGSEARERFEREARATAKLRSPHTIHIYDYGVTSQGALYYAMELLEGFDLDQLVVRFGAQPPERVVHLLLQAACSLSEAHEQGIVHRDVKPANLFLSGAALTPDFLKVLDFGLAKLTRPEASPANLLQTREESVLGTPLYMSPEQIHSGSPVTSSSDVYSLGCVAYWLLTGKPPFTGTSAMEVLFAHMATPASRPSLHAPAPIPAELDELVLSCLAKTPGERPPTMRALHEQLTALALGNRWTFERASAWWAQQTRTAREGAPADDPTVPLSEGLLSRVG